MVLLLFIFTLFLEVQPQRLSDQVWLTVRSVQKDTSTAQLRYDRPTDRHIYIKVLNQNERPVITVTHDYQTGDFRVYCQIPGSDNAGYACFIYIGDENRLILKSQKPPGKTQCISTLHENDLFNNLKSVKSKVMSCSYSLEPASKLSPYSDKFNLTAFLPVQIQSPSTTKASISYSTTTFSTSEITTTLESITWYETTINPTTENTHPSHTLIMNMTAAVKASTPGKTDGHRTPQKKTWLIMAVAATSGGIFLTGLMGICLFCIRQKKRKKSPMNPSVAAVSQSPDDDAEDNEKHSEEHEEKLYHVYCTIPDVSEDTHELYSLAQTPNHSLLI